MAGFIYLHFITTAYRDREYTGVFRKNLLTSLVSNVRTEDYFTRITAFTADCSRHYGYLVYHSSPSPLEKKNCNRYGNNVVLCSIARAPEGGYSLQHHVQLPSPT